MNQRNYPCSVDGCILRCFYARLCWRHLVEQRQADGDLCSIESCDQGRFSRGMCNAHASAASKAEHGRKIQRYAITCEQCGKVAMVQKRTDGRFCSIECVGLSRIGVHRRSDRWRNARYQLALTAKGQGLGPRRSTWVVDPSGQVMTRGEARPRLWVAGWCVRCGNAYVIVDQLTARFCSLACGKRENGGQRRVRKRGAFVAPVNRMRIYERDGWRCQLCGKKVNRKKAVPHPKAPTLDHIVPLAAGGTHEPKNVQCAHFLCNCRKTGGYANDQLLLFG